MRAGGETGRRQALATGLAVLLVAGLATVAGAESCHRLITKMPMIRSTITPPAAPMAHHKTDEFPSPPTDGMGVNGAVPGGVYAETGSAQAGVLQDCGPAACAAGGS